MELKEKTFLMQHLALLLSQPGFQYDLRLSLLTGMPENAENS